MDNLNYKIDKAEKMYQAKCKNDKSLFYYYHFAREFDEVLKELKDESEFKND